jgi:hypothetical protein
MTFPSSDLITRREASLTHQNLPLFNSFRFTSLRLVFHFHNTFPKIACFRGEIPQLLSELRGLAYKGILPDICPLLSASNSLIMIDPAFEPTT